MRQYLFAGRAAYNVAMIPEGRVNGPPLVALPMIADGHATSLAGAYAPEQSIPM